MGLYILLIVELFMIMLTLTLFDFDILAPSVITNVVFFIATVFVIPSSEIWEVNIGSHTILTVLCGLIIIAISSFTAKMVSLKTGHPKKKGSTISLAHCHVTMERVLAISSVILTSLYLVDALRVGSSYGGVGLNAIGYMKEAYISNATGLRMNGIIRQGFKIVMAFAYFSAFIFANNCLVQRESFRKNISYIISFLCGCLITIFSGSRAEILRLLSALLVSYSFIYREKNKWSLNSNRTSLSAIAKKFSIPTLLLILAAFLSRSIVKIGGTGGTDISSIIQYASFYIGSPIQVLNIKLGYFDSFKELIFGTKTSIPEFVYLGGLDYGGNVATILGSCISCNGLINMAIYLSIVYFIGNFVYYRLCGTTSSLSRNRAVILFSYIYFVFTMSYYSEGPRVLLQTSNLLILVIIYFAYSILLKYKFVVR